MKRLKCNSNHIYTTKIWKFIITQICYRDLLFLAMVALKVILDLYFLLFFGVSNFSFVGVKSLPQSSKLLLHVILSKPLLSSYTPNFSFEPLSPLENAKIIHLLDRRRRKKRKCKWEFKHIYQNHWATRFTWFEPICGTNEKMKMVCSKICNEIKGKK